MEPESLERGLAIRILRVEAVVQGVVIGAMAGMVVFVATNWLILRGGPAVGPHLALLGQFFPGYEVTFVGSLIGFAWAFAYGFVSGYAVSALYNRIVLLRARKARRGETVGGD